MSKKAFGETESSSADTALAFMLMPSSQSQRRREQHDTAEMVPVRARNGGVFECRTCGRRFPTYQALGGHRASHSRRLAPPRPRTRTLGDDDGSACARPCRLVPKEGTDMPIRGRAHGCPVCGVEFAVGQALGGHMKRHRVTDHADPRAHRHGAGKDTTSVEADSDGDQCTGEICLHLNLSQAANCAKCRNATLGAAAKTTSLLSD